MSILQPAPTLFAAALMLLGCDSTTRPAADDSALLTGTVTYRERMALPPGATVRVQLEHVSRADAPAEILAEEHIKPTGQVPVPFTLHYDAARIDERMSYAVRAQIRAPDGALLWTTDRHHGVLTRGNPATGVELVLRRVGDAQGPPPRRVAVYDCDGDEVIASFENGSATLHGEDRDMILARVPSASGTRYEANGQRLWVKGEEAMIELDGRSLSGCRNAPRRVPWERARLGGAVLRAVGNEPGWHLEIDADERLTYVGDYGQTRMTLTAGEPGVEGTTTKYRAAGGGHELMVVFEQRRCNDSMVDESYPLWVTLQVDGRELQGCGRRLGQ